MAFATVGVIDFVFGTQGWSEKYIFKTQPLALVSALPLLQQIAWGRTAFLGLGCYITFARVSSTSPSHDGLACDLPYPVGPHPALQGAGSTPIPSTFNAPNDPSTVFQMRFETAAGNFWQRYFHCPPDSWVAGKVLNPALLPYLTPAATNAAINDMSPTGGGSLLQICSTFWRYLINNTAYAKRGTGGNYTVSAFDFITFRQITDKKMGRPFGVSRGRRPKTLIS